MGERPKPRLVPAMPARGDVMLPAGGDVMPPAGGDVMLLAGGDVMLPGGGDVMVLPVVPGDVCPLLLWVPV